MSEIITAKNGTMSTNAVGSPVYLAARSVGVIKPQFDPGAAGFLPPSLSIMGTGFWVKGTKSLITCAHVVQDVLSNPVEEVGMLVVGGNGAEYRRARVSILDSVHDLAVLSIDAPKDFIDKQSSMGLEIAKSNPPVTTPVAYAGFPFGTLLLDSHHSPTYSEGVVSTEIHDESTRKTIQISGPVAGGFSGSPIVLKDRPDQVVALLSNSPTAKVGEAHIFRGISWRHMQALCSLANS